MKITGKISVQIVSLFLWVVAMGMLLTACGGGGDNVSADATGSSADEPVVANTEPADVSFINVVLNDSYYGESDNNIAAPPVWRVRDGTFVVAQMKNFGSLKHNWAIIQPGVQVPVPYEEGENSSILMYIAGMLYKNNETTVTFTAPDVGQYQIICTVSGHYPDMQGVLIVE
ncbi:MAG: hypothetical protein AAF639_27015 [Chloroflexota bacterium]